MSHTEGQSHFEQQATPGKILERVGLTLDEVLKREQVLYFGNERDSLEKKINNEKIRDYNHEIFLMTDEIAPEPVDLIVGVDSPYFSLALDDSARMDLLEVAIKMLTDTGEIRIAHNATDLTLIDPFDVSHAFYDRNLDITTRIVQSETANYLIISPEQKDIS